MMTFCWPHKKNINRRKHIWRRKNEHQKERTRRGDDTGKKGGPERYPGPDKLAELIERGKKKGHLSSSELLDVLEDMELGTDQMDKIYDTLENLGIETVGEDYIPDLADTGEPPVEEME